MFGYVRPVKGELKVRQYEQYKSVYCGLCRQLKKNFGALSTFMLSYDLTFLAMLLADGGVEQKECRCAANPLKKRCVSCGFAGLEKAAAVTVILGYHKFRDGLADEGFFGRTVSRAAMLVFKRAYGKAKKAEPEYDAAAADLLAKLAEIEKEKTDSLDIPADCFAKLLEQITAGTENHRVTGNLLYNLGRWIYIIDAWDDFEEDVKKGRFNPVLCRFGSSTLLEEHKDALQLTLTHSERLMQAAFNLLPENDFSPIIENILTIGLQSAVCRVRRGEKCSVKERHTIT